MPRSTVPGNPTVSSSARNRTAAARFIPSWSVTQGGDTTTCAENFRLAGSFVASQSRVITSDSVRRIRFSCEGPSVSSASRRLQQSCSTAATALAPASPSCAKLTSTSSRDTPTSPSTSNAKR